MNYAYTPDSAALDLRQSCDPVLFRFMHRAEAAALTGDWDRFQRMLDNLVVAFDGAKATDEAFGNGKSAQNLMVSLVREFTKSLSRCPSLWEQHYDHPVIGAPEKDGFGGPGTEYLQTYVASSWFGLSEFEKRQFVRDTQSCFLCALGEEHDLPPDNEPFPHSVLIMGNVAELSLG